MSKRPSVNTRCIASHDVVTHVVRVRNGYLLTLCGNGLKPWDNYSAVPTADTTCIDCLKACERSKLLDLLHDLKEEQKKITDAVARLQEVMA